RERRGGCWDQAANRRRNRIERLINRCEQFRSLATRDGTRGESDRAPWVIAMIIAWIEDRPSGAAVTRIALLPSGRKARRLSGSHQRTSEPANQRTSEPFIQESRRARRHTNCVARASARRRRGGDRPRHGSSSAAAPL